MLDMKAEPEIPKRNNFLKRLLDTGTSTSAATPKEEKQKGVGTNQLFLVQIERNSLIYPKTEESNSSSSSIASKDVESSSITSSTSTESSKNTINDRLKKNTIILKSSLSQNTSPRPKRRKKKSRPEDEIPGLKLAIMADSEFSLGNIEAAFVFWEQALQLQRKKLGERHPIMAQTLSHRGMAFARTGHFFEATLDLEKAVHIKEDSMKEQSSDEEFIVDTADTLIQIAHLQQERGYYVEAMQGLSKALLLKEGVFGVRHESIARITCTMGNFYHRRRRYEEALEMYSKGLAMYKEVGIPKSHPRVRWVRRCLSDKNILATRSIWAPPENKKSRDI